jgi:hypothetical protein
MATAVITPEQVEMLKSILSTYESKNKAGTSSPNSDSEGERKRKYEKIEHQIGTKEHKEELLRRARARYYNRVKDLTSKDELPVKKLKEKKLVSKLELPPKPSSSIELEIPKDLTYIFGYSLKLSDNQKDWALVSRKKEWVNFKKQKKDMINQIMADPFLRSVKNDMFDRIRFVLSKDKKEWKNYAKALLESLLYGFREKLYGETGIIVDGLYYTGRLKEMILFETFLNYCKNLDIYKL